MFNLLRKPSTHISDAFKSKEKPILCLTTLHHRRYVEDVINSIGLPIGSHIRLRYRKQYVCPILWDQINDKKTTPSKNLLLAVAADNSNGSLEVAPIRKGKIFKVSCLGDLATLDIQLLDYVFTATPTEDVYKILDAKTSNLPKSKEPNKSSSGIYLQSLNTSIPELKSNPSVLGWEKVSNAFFNIDKSTPNSEICAPFLYHINKLNGSMESKLKKNGKLTIPMGEPLELEIHTIARPGSEAIKNPLGEIVLDLSHTAANFTSSKRVRVDSSRDVKTIGIITTPVFRAADGHLSIRTNVFKNKQTDTSPQATPPASSHDMLSADKRTETVVARYDFPLRVGGYKPWLASGMIALAAALSVYKISSQGQFKLSDTIIPVIVFLLTFQGLRLGIIKK